MFMKALVLAAALAATSCSALTGSIASKAPVTTATAEKDLTVANIALAAIGGQLVALAGKPPLVGATATTVKNLYDTADNTLKAAATVDAVANAQGLEDQVNKATDLIAQVQAIIHPTNPTAKPQ